MNAGKRIFQNHSQLNLLKWPRPIRVLLGLYFLTAVCWSIWVPPFEKPEELQHFVVVQFVAQHAQMPSAVGRDLSAVEAHQPPLFYVTEALVYKLTQLAGIHFTDSYWWWNSQINSNFYWFSQGVFRDNNQFKHADSIFEPGRDFPIDLIVLRLFSLLLSAVTVLFIYKTAWLAFKGNQALALSAAALAGFLPQFVFGATAVSNDVLVATLGAVGLYQTVKLRQSDKVNYRSYFLLGLIMGAGALTKLAYLALWPSAVLSIPRRRRPIQLQLRLFALLTISIALTCGWWFVRNAVLYGDVLGRYYIINPTLFAYEIMPRPFTLDYFGVSFWSTIGQSFVGKLGFMNIEMPALFYAVWLFAFGLSVVGLIGWGGRLLTKRPARYPANVDTATLLLLLLAILLALVLLIQINLIITTTTQGRYLFQVLAAIAIVFVTGLLEFFSIVRTLFLKVIDFNPSPAWKKIGAATPIGMIAFLVGVNLWSLFGIYLPTYSAKVYIPREGLAPADVPAGEIVKDTRFTQTFTSDCAGLNEIELFLATYARTNTSSVGFRVRDLRTQQRITEQVIPAEGIGNNQWHKFEFAPQADSQGKSYRITLFSPDAHPGNAITVWRSAKDRYAGGEAFINGQPIGADWAFRYRCNQSAAQ